jgi:hypothetical protein
MTASGRHYRSSSGMTASGRHYWSNNGMTASGRHYREQQRHDGQRPSLPGAAA